MKIQRMTVCLSLFLLVFSFSGEGLAQCSTGAANDQEYTAVRSFGQLLVEDIHIEIGNSFLLDCDAQFLSIEISIMLTDYISDGHPPLVMGDTVYCAIKDQNLETIMIEQVVIPTADWEQKLTFDFSAHEFRLAAGQFYFMIGTLQDKWAYIRMGTEYEDGSAQLSMDGTWYEQSGDIMFNMHWDPESGLVPNDGATWGELKALYR